MIREVGSVKMGTDLRKPVADNAQRHEAVLRLGLNRDGSTGMPYVAHLPNRTELYLAMPIRQWDER
jgi:hypothetical protein